MTKGRKSCNMLPLMKSTILRCSETLLNSQQLAMAHRPLERDYNYVANFVYDEMLLL